MRHIPKQLAVSSLIIFFTFSSMLILPVNSSYTSHLYPTDDSWVEAEFPNSNHGSDTSLRVKADSRTRQTYLKFDLDSIPNGKS
ncbi:MAG: CBM96 family carbohydrate-binding protein, partial [Candidatus Heimdallarchaeaceae archaeon]